jgi:anti-anti-sigma regulatory factor
MGVMVMSNKPQGNVIKLTDEKISRKGYKKLVDTVIKNTSGRNREINLDLSGINTMTTQELSDLIYYMNYAKKQGVKLCLIYVSAILKHFFELTRTDNFFVIRV